MTSTGGLDEAFTELVAEHQTAMFTLARRLTVSRDDAEDLAAETFLRAWRSMQQGRMVTEGQRAWLATILLNEHRNRARAASRRVTEVLVGQEYPGTPADRAPGPDEAVEHASQRLRLVAAIDRLPERQRVAVVLRHVLDLPTLEVAMALGCGEATARSHLRRGLAALRANLGEE